METLIAKVMAGSGLVVIAIFAIAAAVDPTILHVPGIQITGVTANRLTAFDGAKNATNLPAGSDGQVLIADAAMTGGVKWTNAASFGNTIWTNRSGVIQPISNTNNFQILGPEGFNLTNDVSGFVENAGPPDLSFTPGFQGWTFGANNFRRIQTGSDTRAGWSFEIQAAGGVEGIWSAAYVTGSDNSSVQGVTGHGIMAGNNGVANGLQAQAVIQAGTTNNNAYAVTSGTVNLGSSTDAAAFEALSAFNSGVLANAYGLLVRDQTAGVNNYAIKTGLGKVSFGDSLNVGSTNIIGSLAGKQAALGFTPVNKAGDTMGGTLSTTGFTNSARTASTFVVAAADKSDTSTATSAVLAATLTDEIGTGVAVFNNAPTFVNNITVPQGSKTAPSIIIANSGGFFGAGTGAGFAIGGTAYLYFNDTSSGLRLHGAWPLSWSSSGADGAGDTFLYRDSAAVVQLGVDAASPVNQTLKAADATGTDHNGANFTLEGGQSTGTGVGGALDLATSLAAESTGSTANNYSTRYHAKGKYVALTHTTATTIETFSLPANKIRGGQMVITCYATNSTPHGQSLTSSVLFDCIAIGTTISSGIKQTDNNLAADTGTLTCAYTILDNGNNTFSIQANANSSLSSPTERCKLVIVGMSGNNPVTITDP